MKLLAQIHSLREIAKGNYIIDLEVISLDKNGIAPNVDFVIKANEISKNRTTNNQGVYRNDELFESKEVIEKIELTVKDGYKVSDCYLPSHISIETEKNISKHLLEINGLKNVINDLESKISTLKDEKETFLKNKKRSNDTAVKELKNKILLLNKNISIQKQIIKDFEDTYIEKKKVRILKKDYDVIQVGDKVWLNDNLKIFRANDCKIDVNDNYFYRKHPLSEIEEEINGTGWRIPTYKDLESFTEYFIYNNKDVLNLHNKCFCNFSEEQYECNYHFFWFHSGNSYDVYWFNKEKITYGWQDIRYVTRDFEDFKENPEYISVRLVKDNKIQEV